jgi:hypothetical protein
MLKKKKKGIGPKYIKTVSAPPPVYFAFAQETGKGGQVHEQDSTIKTMNGSSDIKITLLGKQVESYKSYKPSHRNLNYRQTENSKQSLLLIVLRFKTRTSVLIVLLLDVEVQNVVRQDVARQDVVRQDVVRQDVVRQDVVRQDVVRQDVVRQDVVRQDVVRQDVVRKNVERINVKKILKMLNSFDPF